MKSIKQIRENYNILTEKEEADIKKLTALGRAGLFDANKIPFIKRALEKDPKEMTLAERKILLNLLDQLMSQVLHSSQVYTKVKQNVMRDDLREELLDEKSDYLSKFDPRAGSSWPSEKDMPNVLILKRKSIRVFPGSQKVALYYSQALDRYISIPFGVPNLGIAEDTSEQYKKAKKNKDKSNKSDEQTDKEAVAKVISQMRSGQKTKERKAISNAENIPLSAAGVGSQPGALQARRAIGKAAREKFRSRLASGDLEGAAASAGYLLGKAIRSGVGYAASPLKKMASTSIAQHKKGFEDLKTNVANSALVQKAKTGIGNFKLGREAEKSHTPWRHNPRGSDKKIISPSASFAHKLGRLSGKVFEEETATPEQIKNSQLYPVPTSVRRRLRTTGELPDRDPEKQRRLETTGQIGLGLVGGGRVLGGALRAARAARGAGAAIGRFVRRALPGAAGLAAGALGTAASAAAAALGGGEQDIKEPKSFSLQAKTSKAEPASSGDAVSTRQQQKINRSMGVTENTIKKLKMVNENTEFSIGDKTIVINKNIAEKIVSLYESVNRQNKRKIESMLNESVDSFKKIVEFAVRQ